MHYHNPPVPELPAERREPQFRIQTGWLLINCAQHALSQSHTLTHNTIAKGNLSVGRQPHPSTRTHTRLRPNPVRYKLVPPRRSNYRLLFGCSGCGHRQLVSRTYGYSPRPPEYRVPACSPPPGGPACSYLAVARCLRSLPVCLGFTVACAPLASFAQSLPPFSTSLQLQPVISLFPTIRCVISLSADYSSTTRLRVSPFYILHPALSRAACDSSASA